MRMSRRGSHSTLALSHQAKSMRHRFAEASHHLIATRLEALGTVVLGPISEMTLRHPAWFRSYWPAFPQRRRPPLEPWPPRPSSGETPAALRTVPGIWRDPDEQNRVHAELPLYEFWALYPHAQSIIFRFGWSWVLPTARRRLRALAHLARVAANQSNIRPASTDDPQVLADDIRREASRIGLSQVGFAAYDPRYTFDGYELVQGSVIVCILEQEWAATQTIPSAKAERCAMRTYADLGYQAAALAEYVQSRGYVAHPHPQGGPLASIPYAVEAGLGQLGLNGQLLTPTAGSRCRIILITTNAELVHDSPVDFGIHAICDACQLCVRRCPPGRFRLSAPLIAASRRQGSSLTDACLSWPKRMAARFA